MHHIKILVKDCFPFIGGLFTQMDYDFLGIPNSYLDMLLMNECSLRPVTNLVSQLTPKFSDSKQLTDEALKTLAYLLLTQFRHKWDGLKDVYLTEYNPIYNYYDETNEIISDVLSEAGQESLNGTQQSTNNNISNLSKFSNFTSDTKNNGSTSNIMEKNLIFDEKHSGSDSTIVTDIDKQIKSINTDIQEKYTDNTKESIKTEGGFTTTRTDDLTDDKITTDTGSVTRTDNLTSDTKTTDTGSITRTDDLSHVRTGNTQDLNASVADTSVHAFNANNSTVSLLSVSQLTDNDNVILAKDTFNETVNGSPAESQLNRDITRGTQSFNDNDTGTQTTDNDLSGTNLTKNTGTQSTQNNLSGTDTTTHTGTQVTVQADNSSKTTSLDGSKDNSKTEVGGETIDKNGTEDTIVNYGLNINHNDTGTIKTNLTNDSNVNILQNDNVNEIGSSNTDVSQLTQQNKISDSLATASRERKSIHQGNIGNITTQQMLQEQIELLKFNFIDEVIADVKDFITLPIYI